MRENYWNESHTFKYGLFNYFDVSIGVVNQVWSSLNEIELIETKKKIYIQQINCDGSLHK